MNRQYQLLFGEKSTYEKSNSHECKANSVHRGEIVERAIRRCNFGIAHVARALQVSRKTLYNWFELDDLDFDTIFEIGTIINHDFRQEFPEAEISKTGYVAKSAHEPSQPQEQTDLRVYWMEQYIKLLEKFNEYLIKGKAGL